jgi:hypothetical protein
MKNKFLKPFLALMAFGLITATATACFGSELDSSSSQTTSSVNESSVESEFSSESNFEESSVESSVDASEDSSVESSEDGSEDSSEEIPEKETVTVTFSTGAGYIISGESIATKGEVYTFTVTLSEGYEGGVVKVNGEEVVLTDGSYTIEEVTEALTITVEGVALKSYAVALPTGEGYTVEGETSVVYGEAYSFTITIDEAYSQSAVVVKVNDTLIEEVEGVYTVESVKSDLTIVVEGIVLNTYTVTLPTGEGYTVSGETCVQYGKDYSFAFALTEGYEGGVVKVNGEEVTLIDGAYTIENVTEDIVITVEGVSLKSYNVTLPMGTGYTATGEASVQHGANYTFAVALDTAYNQSAPVVKVNDVQVVAVDGEYTVQAVKGALIITVEGVVLNTYTVILSAGEGYTLSGETAVQYGENYSFAFALTEGYEGGVVKVNGEEVTLIDGACTIEKVTANIVITVESVALKSYAVTLPSGLGYTVSGSAVVQHGKTYTFTVVIAEGYEKSSAFVVTVNGVAVEVGADGIVNVETVTGEIIVAVDGVVNSSYVNLGSNEFENTTTWW